MKAILFDLDDTLIVDERAAADAFLAVGEFVRQRYDIAPETLHQTVGRCAREYWHESPGRPWCLAIGISSWEGLWADFQGDQPEIRVLREWAPDYRHTAWARALGEFGIEDSGLAGELAMRFVLEREQRHAVFPDVLPALEKLSGTHRLAILTNGFSQHQLRKLRGAGLDRYFEPVIVSGDYGFGKPDSRIFEVAISRLAADADGLCVVGDSLSRDIAGAQACGLTAVWINRDNKPQSHEITPDATITSLDQLALVSR